jgi:transposase-like protein
MWGALPPIYNTTGLASFERGVHVHVRPSANGRKSIDRTFAVVYLRVPGLAGEEYLQLKPEAAESFAAGAVFNKALKTLNCPHCGSFHLDAGFFSVFPHKKHQCARCGREFFDRTACISNPINLAKEVYEDFQEGRQTVPAGRKLVVNQSDLVGGLEIWGSNPAFLWTQRRPEESGIHIHGYSESGVRIVDDTFDSVKIDGHLLDEDMVRVLMVQTNLSYLRTHVASLTCPHCKLDHFDRGDSAIRPHREHICENCGRSFSAPGRKKLMVSNPLVGVLETLETERGTAAGL